MMKKYVNGIIVELSLSEIAERQAYEIAYNANEGERLSEEIRNQRNRLLSDTDWMALSDNTITPEWASYRQALRDITDQTGFPYAVIWPTKP